MKPLALILTALALTGCQTCREHPAICAAGITIAATSLALAAKHGHRSEQPRMSIPLVPDCEKLPEMCK